MLGLRCPDCVTHLPGFCVIYLAGSYCVKNTRYDALGPCATKVIPVLMLYNFLYALFQSRFGESRYLFETVKGTGEIAF